MPGRQLNPSGVATKAQREEAKEAAKERAMAEAADGRFRRHNHYPVLWDGQTQTLYAGTTSASVLERLQALFRETFDRPLEPITAGSLARGLAPGDPTDPDRELAIFGSGPIAVAGQPAGAAASVAWAGDDPTSLDYLGNEFLVWIWHVLQNDGETVKLSDGSEATVMLAKTLTLDCPRGETGRDQLTDDAPTRLPEAFRALQAGKLPRKAGMILVRHGAQYELTLQAETLAVSGAALPKPEDDGPLAPRAADRPDRQPPPPDRVPRPAVRSLSPAPDRYRLDRRAGPHPTVAPGRVIQQPRKPTKLASQPKHHPSERPDVTHAERRIAVGVQRT